MGLFAKDITFYELLDKQAAAAEQAARAFYELSTDFSKAEHLVAKIEQIENDADEITHELANRVDSTFVTPLDKEDLRDLSSGLDDITDAIEAASARISLYRLTVARPDLLPLAQKLVEVTAVTREAVSRLRTLRDRKSMQEALIRIHTLEGESDKAFRSALDTLLNSPDPDPIQVIKWKEIYDRVEVAIDKCEDVANTVESVVVKYA